MNSGNHEKILRAILIKPNEQEPVDGVYNFVSKSEQSQFYQQLFSESLNRTSVGSKYQAVKNNPTSVYQEMGSLIDSLHKELPPNAVVIEIGGGVFQNRCGNAVGKFENYFPLDISLSSIARYCKKYERLGIVANASELPIRDESVDCVFTHTFLEHPIEPDKVAFEIARIIKPGGLVLHRDAWHCRWWHRFGCVGLKAWKEMTLKEKAVVLAARITELPVLRFPPMLVRRAIRLFLPRNGKLNFRRLRPNYELHLGCDEDAATSIDPIDLIRVYEFYGFELSQPLSWKERILFRQPHFVMKKLKPLAHSDIAVAIP